MHGKITVSVIKADVGGYVGHSPMHPDLLKTDPAFDEARKKANKVADYLRHHGPFEPHRLGLDDLEYTTMPQLMKKLEDRFVSEEKGGT